MAFPIPALPAFTRVNAAAALGRSFDDDSRAEADPAPLIARQVIVNADRQVVGYELFNRARAADAHTAASDAALLFSALSNAGPEGLLGDKTLFINCTHDTLSVGHLDLIHPDRVVLEIQPLSGHFASDIARHTRTLTELQKRGFRFAFDHSVLTPAYAAWLPMASYIKLDLIALDGDSFERLACAAQTYSNAELIAEKVETAAQFDQVTAYGINLYQGFWLGTPKLVKTRRIAASQASVQRLVQLVRRDASTSEFEELFKHDAVLAFNLMHLIHAAGFGVPGEVNSFGQAVRLLGVKRLFQWATLMQSAVRVAGCPAAIGSTAVVRGRLMELLATELLSPEESGKAFMVGTFSLLDEILGEPMARSVGLLALPPAVNDALLHRRGLFAPLLELVEACEHNDADAVARCAEFVRLSSREVHLAHLQALNWASEIDF